MRSDKRMRLRRNEASGEATAPNVLIRARSEVAAFDEFYRENATDVMAYFYRRTMCPETAGDLTSEAFARALVHVERYDPERGTPRGWLFGIAGNLFSDWLRSGRIDERARRRLGIDRIAVDDETIERVEALVDVGAHKEALREAVGQLSPKLRDAVLLRVGLDLPYEEVAARLEITEGAARVRVSRALVALAELMDVSAT